MDDEPAQTLYLSNLFSDLSLQHLNGLGHRCLLVLELLGDGDSIFLELSVFSILQGERIPEVVLGCGQLGICRGLFILWVCSGSHPSRKPS